MAWYAVFCFEALSYNAQNTPLGSHLGGLEYAAYSNPRRRRSSQSEILCSGYKEISRSGFVRFIMEMFPGKTGWKSSHEFDNIMLWSEADRDLRNLTS